MRSLNLTESMNLDDHRRGVKTHPTIWKWINDHVHTLDNGDDVLIHYGATFHIPVDRVCPLCALAMSINAGHELREIEITRVKRWVDQGVKYHTCLCAICADYIENTENRIMGLD